MFFINSIHQEKSIDWKVIAYLLGNFRYDKLTEKMKQKWMRLFGLFNIIANNDNYIYIQEKIKFHKKDNSDNGRNHSNNKFTLQRKTEIQKKFGRKSENTYVMDRN